MKYLKRLTGLLLVLAICITGIQATAIASNLQETAPAEVTGGSMDAQVVLADNADGAAFGEAPESGTVEAWRLEAWTNDAMSADQVKALLNRQTLHPQRTGWDKLDALIDSMLAQAGGSDAYSKLWHMYDWMVKTVTYDWEGYSYTYASVASYNSVNRYDYLKNMIYEDGLQKSIPDDMANRTYHLLTEKKGVCYDYAIAFAVIARYVGIEAYVMTGLFTFENTTLGAGHHGWSVLMLDGKEYLFDPQRDARNWEQNNRHTGYYFGIPSDKTWRYNPNDKTKGDNVKANQERRASMLPVAAARAHKVQVTVKASGGTVTGVGSYITGNSVTLTAAAGSGYRFAGWFDAADKQLGTGGTYTFTASEDVTITAKFIRVFTVTVKGTPSGTVSGGGKYDTGASAVLKATPLAGRTFEGWYTDKGEKVSDSASHTLKVSGDTTLTALFSGDYFIDVPAGIWYREYAVQAGQQGIVRGNGSEVIFDGNGSFTRAMAVTMIARMAGADVKAAPRSPFTDAPAGAWFTPYVNWAYANSVTEGMSATSFAPGRVITRQEFITMLERYIEAQGISIAPARTPFHDMGDTAGWAKTAVERFYARGLVKGDNHGNLLPQKVLSRSEGTAFIMRTAEYLKSHGA